MIRYSDALLKNFDHLFGMYWNRQWPRNTVSYMLKKGQRRDIVRFLKECVEDPVLDVIVLALDKRYRVLEETSMERLMWKIEQFVIKNIKYTSDKKQWNMVEYWQTPLETWTNGMGDCEDGAILILALAHKLGIPAWRIKLCAGWVVNPVDKSKGGHAYPIFLRNDMTWCVCDFSYYPTSYMLPLRIKHSDNKLYDEIWWTSNWRLSWAQNNTEIEFGGLQ